MELLRALGALAEDAGPAQTRIATALELPALPTPADYTELFAFALYPYASVYLDAQGMLGGDARDRIAGFWRALNLTPPQDPDHLTTMLAFYSGLADAEAAEPDAVRRGAIAHARRAFFWEHLASWLPVYLMRVSSLAPPAYAAWATVLSAAMIAEASQLGTTGMPGRNSHDLPLHLRLAPSLADPSQDFDEFVAGLLAPVRCGFILVRSDLRRIASDLGIGLRHGDRRFALDTLLAEGRAATLRALADHALSAARDHAALDSIWGPTREFWGDRATRSSVFLLELAG